MIADVITWGIGPFSAPHWILTGGLGPAPPGPDTGWPGSPSPYGVPKVTVSGYEALSRLLKALETANFWDGVEVHLIKAAFTPAPSLLLADLTALEADFDGYAAVTLATPTATEYLSPLGDLVAQLDEVIFQPTGSATPNNIFGYWLESTWGGAGARPLTIVKFDQAVAMASPLNALTFSPRFLLGQPRGN